MKRVMFLCISVQCIFTYSVMADVFMKQQTTTVSGKGEKKKSETEDASVWIAADRMATIGTKASMIIRLDKDVAFSIDNEKKSYIEIPLSILVPNNATEEQKDVMAELPAMFANIVKMKVSIEPTSETKKIRDWSCSKYNQVIEMAGIKTVSELWATQDIKISEELLKKFSAAFLAQNPSLKKLGMEMMKESEKIKGYVVSSIANTEVMGKESSSTMEIIEMKEANSPEGIYEVPVKFKKKKYE